MCRDYAHLAITLCRCMNIPARYCTGYLGDIGVPLDPNPMDFSGWFEAYLGGKWHTMDARHNHPRIGRLLMARGRDATDAAISTAFGNAELKRFDILTKEIRLEHPPAIGDGQAGMQQHHFAILVRHAQGQHLRHERTDLARREIHHRHHLLSDQRLGRIVLVIWAEDFLMPISPPKSIVSLMAGLRASGNGSAYTTVPARISTFRKSSNAIVSCHPLSCPSPMCRSTVRRRHAG